MNGKGIKKAFENPEFLRSREARPLRIMSEYLFPEKKFHDNEIFHTVVFFGSARLHEHKAHPYGFQQYYAAAEEFAYKLAILSQELKEQTGEQFYICTGGGPGIMEAANKGASRAGNKTIGLNIRLPQEQEPNPYISPELNFEFHYFFMRKLWFLYQAKAIVVFPGGFGTFDELFETLTMIQTHKLEKLNIPVMLYDRRFWEEIINFDRLVKYDLISEDDLKLFTFFNSADEGVEFLRPQLKQIMENIRFYLDLKFPI